MRSGSRPSSRVIFLIAWVAAVFAASCGKADAPSKGGPASGARSGTANGEVRGGPEGKPLLVATIFPVYDFSRRVAGDRFGLMLLLPPGVEAHSFEPTPGDVQAVARATLFVYTGKYMEPWAVDLAAGAGGAGLRVVDASEGITIYDGALQKDKASVDGHPEGEGPDPHVWLDPTLAARMAETIAEALAEVDPAGAGTYRDNAAAFRAELLALDARIAQGLEGVASRTIVYGGHFAFGYFARRYGLDYVSPYRGFSPDAEPTPRAVAELVDTVRRTGARVVFHEELIDPRVARALAEASGARLGLLDGAHNLSAADLAAGVTYVSIMDQNLRALRDALGAP